MKSAKQVAILLGTCVPLSLGCATLVAAFQPKGFGIPILTLTTTAEDGTSRDRVLARIERDDQLYVSANHWPRAWYNRALENPKVQVTIEDEKRDYLAIPVTEDERDRLLAESEFPFIARIMTGFPPREFLRLDPQ